MLGKKTPTTSAPVPEHNSKPVDTIDTLIGQKTLFKGDLEFSGGLRVDGSVKGNITATDDENSTLVLSELGEVEGNITVPHVIVNGSINGNIKSNSRVELQPKARVVGDIQYRAVEMQLGAMVNGNMVCEPGTGATLTPVVTEVSQTTDESAQSLAS